MKKLWKKVVVCVSAFTILLSFTAQASVTVSDNEPEEIVLLSEDVRRSKDVVNGERGSIVGGVSSEIINESGGNIGFIIQTLCYVECDKISNTAILERYDESRDKWTEVARYQFNAKKADFPSGLSALTNSMTVKNQRKGYYYRIRGIHHVEAEGQILNYSSLTDGLLITEFGR